MNITTVTKILAAMAANDGVLTIHDAKAAGVDRVVLKRAADKGMINRPHRGRYVELDMASRRLALKGVQLGSDAALSHLGGASFWGLDGVPKPALQWSIPHSTRLRIEGVHRRRNFDRLEVVERDGIRVTSVRQTLLDVAATHDADLVERMVESALRAGLLDDVELREWVASQRHQHGGPTLRAVLDRRRPGSRPTGSDVETLCLQLYRRDGLFPERQWEVRDHRDELIGYGDFGFPPKAFISEIDGRETHGPDAAQYDFSRQHRMEDRGYTFRRFTATDVRQRPRYVCDVTRRGLALARHL